MLGVLAVVPALHAFASARAAFGKHFSRVFEVFRRHEPVLGGKREALLHVALALAKCVALLFRPATARAALLFDDAHRAVFIHLRLSYIRPRRSGRSEAVLFRECVAFVSVFG